MAVGVTLQLPDQPSDGRLVFQPLGGDGFTAPEACYLLDEIAVAGDASGGNATILVNMDTRYTNIVSWAQASAQTAGAAIAAELKLNVGNFGCKVAGSGHYFAPLDYSDVNWNPPPLVQVSSLRAIFPNSLGPGFELSAVIYLFNIHAPQRVPLNVLYSSLPRSSALFGE